MLGNDNVREIILKNYKIQTLFWQKIAKSNFGLLQINVFNDIDNICIKSKSIDSSTVEIC